MTPIELRVTEIREQQVDVATLADPEPTTIGGEVEVTLAGPGYRHFTLVWPRDHPLPEIGSTWTLAPKEHA